MLCLCHCRCDFLHSFKLVFIIAVLVKLTRCGNFTPNWRFLEINSIQIGLPTSFLLHKAAHPTGRLIVNFKDQTVDLHSFFIIKTLSLFLIDPLNRCIFRFRIYICTSQSGMCCLRHFVSLCLSRLKGTDLLYKKMLNRQLISLICIYYIEY